MAATLPRRRSAVGAAFLAVAVAASALVLASPAPPAGAGLATVDNGCAYSIDQVTRQLAIALDGQAGAEVVAAGETVELPGVEAAADLPSWLPVSGFNLGVLDEGLNVIPVRAWVALTGTNTEEGTQVVELDAEARTTITVDPSLPEGDPNRVTATPLSVSGAVLPTTTWTATGGTIELRQAGPGTLPAGLPAGPRDAPLDPAGSMLISAQLTNVLRFNLDCQPGTVDTVNPPYPFTPAGSWPSFAQVLVSSPYACDVVGADAGAAAGVIATSSAPGSVEPGAPVELTDLSVLATFAEPGLPVPAGEGSVATLTLGPDGTAVQLGQVTIEATHPGGGVARARLEGGPVTLTAPSAPGSSLLVTVDAVDLSLAGTPPVAVACAPVGTPAGLADVAVTSPPPPPPPPPGPDPTTPPTTAPPATQDGLPEDRTPVTSSATYPMACSYVYDLAGSTPAPVSYQTTVTGTVPRLVRAGSQVTLSDQRWVTTIPWETRGPLVTAFLNEAVTEGETVTGTADATVVASGTVEGSFSASGVTASLGPLHEGQPTTMTFSPPDRTVTAVGGQPVRFEAASARFVVQLRVASLPSSPTVTITFDCQSAAAAGTAFATTEVSGTSDLVAAPTSGLGGQGGSLPRTGPVGPGTWALALAGTALVAGGVALVRRDRRARPSPPPSARRG
jgi:hypothetical protein